MNAGDFRLPTEAVEAFVRTGRRAARRGAQETVMVYLAPLDPIRWPPTHLRNRRMDPRSRGKAHKPRTFRDLN